MEPLLVITNSDAGTADEESLEAALAVLRTHSSVEVQATSNPGELNSVLHRAGSRRIVVAGGDGSLHTVVTDALPAQRPQERRARPAAARAPATTSPATNGIPLDVEEAAQVLRRGHAPRRSTWSSTRSARSSSTSCTPAPAPRPAGAARAGRTGCTRSASARLNLGRLGYPIGALLAAVKPPFVRLRVEVDGEVVVDLDQPILMVAVGNGTQVGGGTELTPYADPGDGKVDVMVSRAIGPLARFGYAATLATGRHPERDDVIYLRGSSVSMSGEEFWCSADGEIYGPERHRTWHVEPAAYSLVVPR